MKETIFCKFSIKNKKIFFRGNYHPKVCSKDLVRIRQGLVTLDSRSDFFATGLAILRSKSRFSNWLGRVQCVEV